MKRGSIVLVGPENEPDPELKKLPRILSVPAQDYADLPSFGREAAVLIMPYADLPVTRAMQPLKLKEYLATGRPVVARDLPSLREWADAVDLVSCPEEFARAALERADGDLPDGQRAARTRLSSEDWDAKAEKLEAWLLPSFHARAEASVSV
jgi:glycosyltransferase involved in cell wall biosynthesis